MPQTYPSKLLLFGEYAVLVGGEGFAIPYPKYSSEWQQADSPIDIIHDLRPFYKFLKTSEKFNAILDLEKFIEDLQNNYYLRSDIPIGMGLGSSGSVVAAVYDKYYNQAIKTEYASDLKTLKKELGEMENYFHETSSGLDPLVILLNKPIHLLHGGEPRAVTEEIHQLNDLNISLFNTGLERKASTQIEIFINKMQSEDFSTLINEEYLPLVASVIEKLLENDKEGFYLDLAALSAFQLQHFSFAIPESVHHQWHAGLQSGKEIYKLCGAGGGGYVLCFKN